MAALVPSRAPSASSATLSASHRAPLVAAPSYFRPVIVSGKAFPLARSNYLSLIENTGYGPPGERDQFPPHLHFGIQLGSQWVDPYGSLVSLYDAAVKADTRSQASLDSLAAAGKRSSWEREASKLFTTFGG